MKVGFRCTDGAKIKHEDCLNHCRLDDRCATISTLSSMAETREWKGKPSTTQLIQPTYQAYLRIKHDFYVAPDSLVFMYIGSRAHKKLEGADDKRALLETYLEDEEMTGIADNLEEEDGELALTDYKTWGSFMVAKSLGIEKVGEVPDPTGAVYKRAYKDKKPGDPKMLPVWGMVPENADMLDTELQLNRYLMFFEDAGFDNIDKLRVQIFVRDGGLRSAKSRGVLKNLYLVPVKKLDREYVKRYFAKKRFELITALEIGALPDICTDKERWEGIRCANFCDVWEFCPVGIEAHKDEGEDNVD